MALDMSSCERVYVLNGQLLAPQLDALFEGSWIPYSDQGGVLLSKYLGAIARVQLGVRANWSIHGLKAGHMGPP